MQNYFRLFKKRLKAKYTNIIQKHFKTIFEKFLLRRYFKMFFLGIYFKLYCVNFSWLNISILPCEKLAISIDQILKNIYLQHILVYFNWIFIALFLTTKYSGDRNKFCFI